MAELYHIYLDPKEGVTSEQIKKKLDLAVDWYKYAENCWIVETTSDASKWQLRLRPLAEPDGSLLIFKLDHTERQGWMTTKFWDWLKDKGKA
jgi:hypothetical protein